MCLFMTFSIARKGGLTLNPDFVVDFGQEPDGPVVQLGESDSEGGTEKRGFQYESNISPI